MDNVLFSIKNVSKIFPNGNIALSEINLEIFEGQCLLIAGSNGSGKTQLMRIITGLVETSRGTVLFKGASLDGSLEKVRRSVGLVFQDADAQLVGDTVAEDIAFGPKNLGFPKNEVEFRVSESADQMGLGDKLLYSPRRLSGGEKRRLAVAGILAMGCDTLIFDEPFANLDWPGVIQVLRAIKSLKETGKTLIILTHELEKVLAFADRLLILHRGIIKDDGPPEEVLNRIKPEYGVRDPRKNYSSIKDCSWLEE